MILCCNKPMSKGQELKLGFHSEYITESKEVVHTWHVRQANTYQCQNCGHEVDVIKGFPYYCYEKPEVNRVIEE